MNVELLAPAGSYQTVVAAIAAGADAVYMGGSKFGARAYAENGDEDTIIKAIKYVHLHGKALYLTVNTLLKNREMEEELYDYLLPYYRAGLDAVIVQDVGVLSFVKKYFPDLPIHASTQMTITGAKSGRLLEEMGCTRIVTARELSLDEIAKIHQETNIEIESFVHGALCYCYSGQCLMSSMLGGRSGNRGRCAQPCRLPYQVYDHEKRVNNEKNQYALSPKDMCTIDILPQIIEAGVFSLKIEGRMKKPEYTAGVVRIYRKYLDLYEKNPETYRVEEKDKQELFDLYNRDGFHTGYYLDHNGPNMMAVKNKKASEGQKKRNDELFEELRESYIDKTDFVNIDGKLELLKGQKARLMIGTQVYEGAVVDEAMKHPLDKDRVFKQICKTGNTPFTFRKLDIQMDSDIFMPMQALNELRRNALCSYEELLVSSYYRNQEQPYERGLKAEKIQMKLKEGFSVSVDTREQLNTVLHSLCVKRIYASISIFSRDNLLEDVKNYIEMAKRQEKEAYLVLPYIVRNNSLTYVEPHLQEFVMCGLDGYLIRNLESLYLLKEKNLLDHAIADANLYTYNNRAQEFYRSCGINEDTVPYELNGGEISHRDNGQSEMIVYGYQPLMISAQCVRKNFVKCDKKSQTMVLQDRYNIKFQVQCVCDYCYNIIYNSLPLAIIKEAKQIKGYGLKGLRLCFTRESGSETDNILREFYNVYMKKQESGLPNDRFTKGHLKRGVE